MNIFHSVTGCKSKNDDLTTSADVRLPLMHSLLTCMKEKTVNESSFWRRQTVQTPECVGAERAVTGFSSPCEAVGKRELNWVCLLLYRQGNMRDLLSNSQLNVEVTPVLDYTKIS